MLFNSNGQIEEKCDKFFFQIKNDIEKMYKEMEKVGISIEDFISLYHYALSLKLDDVLVDRIIATQVKNLKSYLYEHK